MPTKTVPKHFGHIIAAERRRLGLSVYALARLVGLKAQTIHNLERGSEPLFGTARRLAAALGLDLDGIAAQLPPPEPPIILEKSV